MELFLEGSWGSTALTVLAGLLVLAVCCQIFARRHSEQKEDANPQRTLRSKPVFRVQGLPVIYQGRQVDKAEAEKIIRKALTLSEDVDVSLDSLAKLPTSPNQTATLSFSDMPPEVKRRIQGDDNHYFTFKDSTRTLSLTLDKHFIDFTPLYCPPDQDHRLDVIALPGLGGHAFGSFKARNGTYMWLRDGLCESLPSARVFIYGYDTRLQNSSAFQSLQDLGLDFGHKLVAQIKASNTTSKAIRPIVLVGQSMGGLVIKEAMCKLASGTDEEADILKSIEAVLFFGTPNSGMEISSLVPMVSGQANEQFLWSLGHDSVDLRRLGETWTRIVDARAQKYTSPTLRIYSFYETKKSPSAVKNTEEKYQMTGPLTVLVDRISATHGRPWQDDKSIVMPIHATHSEMAKFMSIEDGLYRDNIVSWMKDVLERNQSKYIEGWLSPHHWSLVMKCTASLHFQDQDSREERLEVAKNSTCEWIFKNETYNAWLSGPEPRLWIEGHAGVGKSTLLRHAFVRYRSEPPNNAVVASHFFWGSGADLQKSPLGLYRSLLFQILPHFPVTFGSLISTYDERERRKEQTREQWSWRSQELRKTLEDQLLQASQKRPITFFIDALDECSAIHRRELRDFLETLANQDTTKRFKLCVSSRHYRSLYKVGLQLSVQDNNSQDLRTFVNNEMSSLGPAGQLEIGEKIIAKADGLFQWVKLVCERVLECKENGGSLKMIHSEIDKCPPGLDGLYESLIKDNPQESEQTLKLFQSVCFAPRPLTLRELQWILVLSPDMEEKSIQECWESEHFRDDPSELRNAIKHLSKGLIYVANPEDPSTTVQDAHWDRKAFFVHQSVPEFLRDKGFSKLQGSKSTTNPIELAHRNIILSCLRYAFLERGDTEFSLDEMDPIFVGLRLRIVLEDCIKSAESQGFDQSYILEVFTSLDGRERLQKLSHFFRLLPGRKFRHLPQLLARLGAASAMRSLVAFYVNPNQPIDLEKLPAVSQWICRICDQFPQVLERSLSGHINLNQTSEESSNITAIQIAARWGHADVVKCLLECPRVDANQRFALGETALDLALRQGHRRVIELLLQSEAVDPNIPDSTGTYAWTLYDRFDQSTDGLDLLFESPRLNFKIRDRQGDTAAHSMLKLILKSNSTLPRLDWSRIDPNIQNRLGQTVLHLAIFNGHIDAAKAILEIDSVDLYLKDWKKETPVFELFNPPWLCQETEYEGDDAVLLKLILSKMKMKELTEDKDENTLLHRAAKLGYLRSVKLLLQDGRIDPNETNRKGKTALALAERIACREDVEPQSLEILEMLRSATQEMDLGDLGLSSLYGE